MVSPFWGFPCPRMTQLASFNIQRSSTVPDSDARDAVPPCTTQSPFF